MLGVIPASVKTWVTMYRNGQKDLLVDTSLIESIKIREGHRVSRDTYGYRRMTIWPDHTYDITVNSRHVRCVMKNVELQPAVRKKKKFKKGQGTIYKYDYLLGRNFYFSLTKRQNGNRHNI